MKKFVIFLFVCFWMSCSVGNTERNSLDIQTRNKKLSYQDSMEVDSLYTMLNKLRWSGEKSREMYQDWVKNKCPNLNAPPPPDPAQWILQEKLLSQDYIESTQFFFRVFAKHSYGEGGHLLKITTNSFSSQLTLKSYSYAKDKTANLLAVHTYYLPKSILEHFYKKLKKINFKEIRSYESSGDSAESIFEVVLDGEYNSFKIKTYSKNNNETEKYILDLIDNIYWHGVEGVSLGLDTMLARDFNLKLRPDKSNPHFNFCELER